VVEWWSDGGTEYWRDRVLEGWGFGVLGRMTAVGTNIERMGSVEETFSKRMAIMKGARITLCADAENLLRKN